MKRGSVPENLPGEPELARPFLAWGEAERWALAGEPAAFGTGEARPRLREGLVEGSPCRGTLGGGELDPRLRGPLRGGCGEEEELPEEDAEGERRLEAQQENNNSVSPRARSASAVVK